MEVFRPSRNRSQTLKAAYSLSLTNPMEAAIRAAIPHHISGIKRIDQNGSDSDIGPLAAVDV